MANTNPTVTGSVSGADPSAKQNAVESKSRLTANCVYSGTIVAANNITKLLTVEVDREIIHNCVYVANSLGGYMGFADTALPILGSSALVVYNPQQSFVMSAQPNMLTRPDSYSGNIAGVSEADVLADSKAFTVELEESESVIGNGYAPSRDLHPGEKEFTNHLGVFIRFLTNIAQMTAGDLAKVEVCLLNDMVRIVDNYFVHHSVGGDELIWSNGRCNYESHFTSYPHEAEGKKKPSDPLVTEKDGVVDETSIEDPWNETGRWRKSTYTGYLGDMIHTWITDPTTALSNLGQESHRAGKYRAWVGSDGMVMVQSTSAIHVEVVPRIVVPTIFDTWNHPDPQVKKLPDEFNKDFLKMWGKGPYWTDLTVACWQMRSYAKYITLWHSLDRFRQLEEAGGCKIQSEKDSPAPSPTNQEADRVQANPDNGTPHGAYASFTMDQMGSISMISNGATSVILNQGNVQITAPGNIEINAGATLSLNGRDLTAQSLHRMELASLAGNFILKARTNLQMLCELGRIWLKSDATGNIEQMKQKAKDNYPVPNMDIPEDKLPMPVVNDFGIVLDSPGNSILLHGATGVVNSTSADESEVVLQALGQRSAVAVSGPQVRVWGPGGIFVRAHQIAVTCARFKLRTFKVQIGSILTMIGNLFSFNGHIRTAGLSSMYKIVSQTADNAIYTKDYPIVPLPEDQDTIDDSAVADNLAPENMNYPLFTGELDKFIFAFNDWKVGDNVLAYTSMKAAPWYDTITAGGYPGVFGNMPWDPVKLLIPATRTAQKSAPWPGNKAGHFEFEKDTPPLGFVWDKAYEADKIGTVDDMKLKPFYRLYNKIIPELQ